MLNRLFDGPRGVGRAAASLAGVALALMLFGGSTAQAQFNSIGRGPSINVGPRIPNINMGPGPRYVPGVDVHVDEVDDPPLRRRPPPREAIDAAGNGGGQGGRKTTGGGGNARFVPKEVIIEINGSPSEAQIDALARRFRLTRIDAQPFALNGSTLFRWRIPDGRSVQSVAAAITASGEARASANFRYRLQQTPANAAPTPADATRYPALKLHLSEAHQLARGTNVTVAVIDSGIDAGHPELAGSVSESYDALKSSEGPHSHGTGIAGAIAAHARLIGSAPAVRMLAIRAFGVSGDSAESTSFSLLRSLDFAVTRGARVINMSFAGPEDPTLERALATIAGKGIVLIAAAGNAGPSSPPLYPAAYRQVIAVSATDASDRLFVAANRGKHIALAAPGVDVLLPAPQAKYQVASGTSFAAAYVSGLAALMLERNPTLSPDEVRAKLTTTARDLGPPGRDDQFGAGLADAAAALAAAGDGSPVSASAGTPGTR